MTHIALAVLASVSIAAAQEMPEVGATAEQVQLVRAAYPGKQLIFTCTGNFSGHSGQEIVVGLAGPARQLTRAALVWDQGKWTLHDIDRELESDADISHHSPMKWVAPPDNEPPKCNANIDRAKDLSLHGKRLGRELFRLPRGRANACFATDETYNNWDCVVYDPAKRRFRLWYQQVFAD